MQQIGLNAYRFGIAWARVERVGLLRVRATRAELATDSIRQRFPTGVTLLFEAGSLAEDRATVAAYRSAAKPMAVMKE